MISPPKPATLDELEALIKEARERQLRRRLLAAAGIAIAAAFGLSVYAFTIGAGTQGSDASGGPGAIAPLCRSQQLSASVSFNGAAGSIFGAVMIYDTSRTACSLPLRQPEVRISSPGAQPPIKEGRAQLNPNALPRLKRGAVAEVYVEWANWCGRAPTAMSLRFGPGLQVSAPLGHTRPPCSAERLASPSTIDVTKALRRR